MTARQIRSLERRLSELEATLLSTRAEIAGVRAQLSVLKAGNKQPDGGFVDLPRTEAILQLLESEPGGLTPKQITEALVAGGRSEVLNVVGATLSHLRTSGRVVKPERGKYTLCD